MNAGAQRRGVLRYPEGEQADDVVAIEEPLEIRLRWTSDEGPRERPLLVTMRTPGADADLALGLLYGEGVMTQPADVVRVEPCGAVRGAGAAARWSGLRVELQPWLRPRLAPLDRRSFMSASCGVCGKVSLEDLGAPPVPRSGQRFDWQAIAGWPSALRPTQSLFSVTGGVHGVGLFSTTGALCASAEDVGRHNAVDKVVGQTFAAGKMPLAGHGLMLSGRASFELVQKAAVAGIELVAAVGAPSSLAVEAAQVAGVTLVGFVSAERMNVYTHAFRVSD